MVSKTDVQRAERDLLEMLEGESDGMDPRQLREKARNGYSWAVVDMAFWRLINRRELELDGRLVRLAHTAAA